MKKLSKNEKITFLITILIIVGMIFIWNMHGRNNDEFDYSSNISEIVDNIKVKKNIKLEVNKDLPLKPSNYLEGEKSFLNNVKLDFKKVNINKIGKYVIFAKYQDEEFEIPVSVVDTEKPEIYVGANNFTWYLNDVDTLENLIEYVNIKVIDNYDENLIVDEWIKKLPTKEGSVTYKLKVKDSSGNKNEFELKINYKKQKKGEISKNPDKPAEPVIPDKPNKPNKPTDPDPEEPETPVDPEEPEKPTDPDPEEPETPVDPEEPEKPTDPDPEEPENPVDPEEPEKPIDPEEPENPVDPDPEEPEEPEKPTDPDPEEPEKPIDPEEPEKPTDPEEPEKPIDPEDPIEPEKPEKH